MSYYAARVIGRDIDKELAMAAAAKVAAATATASLRDTTTGDRHSARNEPRKTMIIADRSSAKTCPLCLDALTDPACVPCGHIFCWTCILTHTLQKQSPEQQQESRVSSGAYSDANNSDDGGGRSRCPVCRVQFPSQRVRALYSYV